MLLTDVISKLYYLS